jgi:hypothetical protein
MKSNLYNPAVLDILCRFYRTEDDFEGEEVGKTLLRQLIERWDKLGHFAGELFERNHFRAECNGKVISYSPQITKNTEEIVSFREVVERLALSKHIGYNMNCAYSALIQLNSDLRPRKLEPVVFFSFLVYSIMTKILEYYRGLLHHLQSN